MANAIVALTRGYKDLIGYNSLIARNISIRDKMKFEYDLILFHQGNINESHQNYIQNKSGIDIKFIDISSVWAGGYEGMCKFMIYDIWQQCKCYKYVMRIDEDCIIKECPNNPFELIGDKKYLTSVFWGESHSETNATLPQYLEELTGSKREEFYNNKFPYTNVSLVDVEFMTSIKELKQIAESPLQRPNRWGDLPVLGSILNIYKVEIGTLMGLVYHHASHNVLITCK